MDLHIVGADATADERAAVDALLGPPASEWEGAERDNARDGRTAAGGRAIAGARHFLLPVLHAVQDRIGWVSHGALNYICTRLTVPPAEAWGVVTFYHLLSTEPRPAAVAHVCDDIACRLQGAEQVCRELEARHGDSVKRSPCLGQCDYGSAALITLAGRKPQRFVLAPVTADDIGKVLSVSASAAGGRYGETSPKLAGNMGASEGGPEVRTVPTVPRVGAGGGGAGAKDGKGGKIVRRIGRADPGSLRSYRKYGGYSALERAITIGPTAVIAEVSAAGLLGRGGAAFPAGRKWEAVARESARPHYMVCNADESEPGTFKDRVLMEEDPFAVVEAMTICAFATGSELGFLYVRGEYPQAESALAAAITQARAAGLLGANIAGHGLSFDIAIRRGGGAYICGEETALFNSIEGKRGEPRSKPPFPAQSGLFGKPTVVNNVETLVNVLDILSEGGAEWARTGTAASTGTRLFCLSGHVAKPGLYEVACGATVREAIELAGGVAGGRALQAILLGGAAGTFVAPAALDMPLSFEGARSANATLGSGVIMLFDETADLVDTLGRIAEFFRDESCGQCVPCRVGTVRQEELLKHRSVASASSAAPLVLSASSAALVVELGQAMRDASICGLGQTASSAIESAMANLNVFRGSAS